ncbi:vWA domain-containing protein [Longimicrobium sp.]|jgi:Ca-activated chloride channel family protein|uniref:vWA domain-containing protein n=1 Tax=Longimicrobium sp. TaxID=2029185 RepID=UPI002EDBB461
MALSRHPLGEGAVIRWADPFLLHLIPLFPALVAAALLLWWRRRRDVAEALGDPALVRRLAGTDLRAFPRRRVALLIPAAAFLGLAAAGPRWGEVRVDGVPRGDVVLVLDASNSMLVEDVRPNRLERQREIARTLVRRLEGSRVGLVAFAGSGHVLTPLTDDFSALNLYLDALGPDIVHQSGSSLYSALAEAVNLLDVPGAGENPGSIVLITDGEALEPSSMVGLSLERAVRRRVAIHTVGLGTEAGGPVPNVDPETGRRRGFKRDPETRETAVSRLERPLLSAIARTTGGTAQVMPNAQAVAALANAAASGERGPGGGDSHPDNRYEWFLALALALIAADALSEHRRPQPRAEGRQ